MTGETQRERRARQPHSLYRVFDAAGRLLYIGASCDPVSRLYSHDKTQAWATDIHHITVAWFSCRADALEAEKVAIKNEMPKWNHTFNDVKPRAVGRFSPGFRHDDRATWEYPASASDAVA